MGLRVPFLKPLVAIALVAVAPALVFALQRDFEHAHFLYPSVPLSSSAYLEARGAFPWTWLITQTYPSLPPVTFWDRFFPYQLVKLYLVCFFVVAILWMLLRLLARSLDVIQVALVKEKAR